MTLRGLTPKASWSMANGFPCDGQKSEQSTILTSYRRNLRIPVYTCLDVPGKSDPMYMVTLIMFISTQTYVCSLADPLPTLRPFATKSSHLAQGGDYVRVWLRRRIVCSESPTLIQRQHEHAQHSGLELYFHLRYLDQISGRWQHGVCRVDVDDIASCCIAMSVQN